MRRQQMSCTHKLTAQKKHQTSTAPSSPAPARDPFAGTSFTWLVVFCSFWGGREDSEGHGVPMTAPRLRSRCFSPTLRIIVVIRIEAATNAIEPTHSPRAWDKSHGASRQNCKQNNDGLIIGSPNACFILFHISLDVVSPMFGIAQHCPHHAFRVNWMFRL